MTAHLRIGGRDTTGAIVVSAAYMLAVLVNGEDIAGILGVKRWEKRTRT